MSDWIVWAGSQFSPEAYLFWTRIQCLLWTAADVVIVLALLGIGNAARRRSGQRLHWFSYLVLAATMVLAPFVIFAPTGGLIFVLELLITVPHFVLILYLLGFNAPLVARLLDERFRNVDRS
ncbi:MAG: hypothetical protein IT368_07570 [Candidatus Hydrogenedentes bacterium]|nr:hypothetical protein [Candidatus Hydrogenedentota bacterium]